MLTTQVCGEAGEGGGDIRRHLHSREEYVQSLFLAPSRIGRLQAVGSYKPNLANFDYAIQHIKEDFGIEKDEILIVANSKYHDVQP